MDWDFVLLDFDGLLVDTEKLHYRAYQRAVEFYKEHLPWSFEEFCLKAHISHEVLFSAIFSRCPRLEVSWDELYRKKKESLYLELEESGVQLMPGVASFLERFNGTPTCVVTNSPKPFIEQVVADLPLLNKINYWITREDYKESKPSPEGYLKAIALYAKPSDKIIGFEDTPKGISALLQTKAQPVLISKIPYQELQQLKAQGVIHYPDLFNYK